MTALKLWWNEEGGTKTTAICFHTGVQCTLSSNTQHENYVSFITYRTGQKRAYFVENLLYSDCVKRCWQTPERKIKEKISSNLFRITFITLISLPISFVLLSNVRNNLPLQPCGCQQHLLTCLCLFAECSCIRLSLSGVAP